MPHPSSALRNVVVCGHVSAGKTLLCEAMLVCAGRLGRAGSIAVGSTVSDYHPSERTHQLSIHATPLHFEWLGQQLNLLDCPGAPDFAAEGLAALRVGDSALLLIHAAHGLGAGTDAAWDYATHFDLPKAIAINGLDKPAASFDATLETARAHFGKNLFPLTLPLDAGPGFSRVLDVLRCAVVTYRPGGNGAPSEQPAAGADLARVQELHRQLMEYVAESDDALLERFCAEGVLPEDVLRAGLHRAVQAQGLVPVFAVCAETNVGVARLLDFLAKYGSSPLDRAEVAARDASGLPGTVSLTGPEPVAYVFKTMNEPGVGELSLFRVYSGALRSGAEVYNAARQTTERLGQLYVLNGRERTPVDELPAGAIGAAGKLRATHTGDTLCTSRFVVELPRVELPRPVIHAALGLRSAGDEDKLATGLATLHLEDPTFLYRVDDEVHQTIVSGQGDLHLQVIGERLDRRFGVKVDLLEPRIAYRETVRGAGESRYRHKKQSGGAGQFAEVWLRLGPAPRGTGVDFQQTLTGNNVDRVFVPAVEKGVRTACAEGVLAGCRVTDVAVEFYDGKTHPVDSKDIAFQVAGYHAFKEAFAAASPCLLEPVCNVTVTTPAEHLGAVLGDLSARRAHILGVDTDGHFQAVRAQVPQAGLHRFSLQVRALTGGRGRHAESFSHYAPVAPDQKARLIAELRARRDGDATK